MLDPPCLGGRLLEPPSSSGARAIEQHQIYNPKSPPFMEAPQRFTHSTTQTSFISRGAFSIWLVSPVSDCSATSHNLHFLQGWLALPPDRAFTIPSHIPRDICPNVFSKSLFWHLITAHDSTDELQVFWSSRTFSVKFNRSKIILSPIARVSFHCLLSAPMTLTVISKTGRVRGWFG